jgi:anti-sigma factor ChrR (cupin superfamily)
MEVGDDRSRVLVIDIKLDDHVRGNCELLLGDSEVVLEGICNGLLLPPHEGSGVLTLTAGSGKLDNDKGKVDCGHVILSGGGGGQTNHG